MIRFPRRVFCDTSFFYACLDPLDENHAIARVLAEEAEAARSTLWVTWDIISETLTLLRYRSGHRAALTFLSEVKPTLRVRTYGDRVRQAAEDVFRRFGRDRRLSYCDAISFIVVSTLLSGAHSLAFDRDYRALGLPVLPERL
jgi:predicted nucleic acid-binding protein